MGAPEACSRLPAKDVPLLCIPTTRQQQGVFWDLRLTNPCCHGHFAHPGVHPGRLTHLGSQSLIWDPDSARVCLLIVLGLPAFWLDP